MPVRVARNTDAANIAQVVNDFWATGIAGGVSTETAGRVQARLADPNVVMAFDTTTHAFCEVWRSPRLREFKVETLLPRSVSRSALILVLRLALDTCLARFPADGSWRIWAEFVRGRNAVGQLDGGRALCEAWTMLYPGATIRQVGGRWVVEWTLAAAATI